MVVSVLLTNPTPTTPNQIPELNFPTQGFLFTLNSIFPTSLMIQKAYFAGGCFWCIEAAFNLVEGVQSAVSGYCNGTTNNPTYKEVCSGNTGHAEVVEITYHQKQISYQDLLYIFFSIHDPTTLNRQGADTGSQYRSAIFYTTTEEKQTINHVITELTNNQIFNQPIITEITPLHQFYPAEEHHQNYYQQNILQPYCMAVISPKISKLRQKWQHLLKGKK